MPAKVLYKLPSEVLPRMDCRPRVGRLRPSSHHLDDRSVVTNLIIVEISKLLLSYACCCWEPAAEELVLGDEANSAV